MGREVRRVPLDFDWPIGKTWDGFLIPDGIAPPACADCSGHGVTTAHRWVAACARMLLMLDDDIDQQARGREMHPYFRDFYTSAYGTRPSPDIREFGTGLAGREGGFMGHDAIDGWHATEKIIAAAGLDPNVWGRCATCGGKGSIDAYDGQSADAEAWTPTDPPEGDGWQLWETVSEGSPISPVFDSAEGLAGWMASPSYAWGISTPMDYEAALRFVNDGWAPSMVISAATGVVAGEKWVGEHS